MTLNTTLIIVLVSIFYLVVPFLILLVKNKKTQKILSIVSLCTFFAILIVGTLGKIDISKTQTTITFEKFGNWADKKINLTFSNLTKQDILINILMLIPLGTFSAYATQNKSWWAQILIATAIGLCSGFLIEFCQFLFPVPRSVQLSDAIFNMISATIGATIFVIYKSIIDKIQNKNN